MEVQKGFPPSYDWRSMLHAKEVLDLGARWMIRNGKKVRIWKDRWLPEQANFKIWSPIKNLQPDATVSELIDEDTKQWKRDVIFCSFNHFEAAQILSISISLHLPEDSLSWHWEHDGSYFVRSAYHLLSEEKNRNVLESSDMRDQGLWKAIWKAPVSNSVKNFIWRLARNILPTRHNLGKKGMKLDMSCPIYQEKEETQDHIFLHCMPIRCFGLPLSWASISQTKPASLLGFPNWSALLCGKYGR